MLAVWIYVGFAMKIAQDADMALHLHILLLLNICGISLTLESDFVLLFFIFIYNIVKK